MTQKDLISTIQLILGLFPAIILFILIKRGKIEMEKWPSTFGIGLSIYAFLASMIEGIILRPKSEFFDYTITSLLSALVFGILGYIGGRILVRNAQNKRP